MEQQPAILVRAYQRDDAPALWSAFHSAIHQIACADHSPEQLDAWAPAQPDLARWSARMEGINPFVAEINGWVVGYADVQKDGYIDHFFVAGTAARQGVGSALMRRIHQQAANLNINHLHSQVSITARPFFEHFGFEVETAQQTCLRGVMFNNFRMQKILQAASGGRMTG